MTSFANEPVSLGLPLFSPITIPILPSLSVSDAERSMIATLQARAWRTRPWMMLTDSYYRGEQLIADLGIAIPPELTGLRTLVGWPRVAVDPLLYRLRCDGFRLPGATDVDSRLGELWDGNDLGSEQALAYKDSFVKGRGYLTIGSPSEYSDTGLPEICVESPLNMSVLWDVRSLQPKAALQTYWVDAQRHAALYLPEQTIHMGQDDVTSEWVITDRDKHNFGWVPVVRMPNAQESDRRDGVSEITTELMSVTDAACRTLLGLEVAREFYSVPQKYIIGATEADFQNADGTSKTAWKTYISHILGLEADDEGNLPTVGQFKAYDPAIHVKIVEMYASQAASITGAPPQELGLYTQGNPISADSLNASEARRDRYARHKMPALGSALVRTMKMALRFMNNGELPAEFRRMEADWMPPETLNITQQADAMVKLVSAGSVPPTSDVVHKRVGFTAIEREQLALDLKADAGASILAELASSLQAKEARTDLTVARDINPNAVKPIPPTTP